MNAERILIASECIGDAKWFIKKTTDYSNQRILFGRPIGQNRGVQFPIAKAFAAMRAAELMVHAATRLHVKRTLQPRNGGLEGSTQRARLQAVLSNC